MAGLCQDPPDHSQGREGEVDNDCFVQRESVVAEHLGVKGID